MSVGRLGRWIHGRTDDWMGGKIVVCAVWVCVWACVVVCGARPLARRSHLGVRVRLKVRMRVKSYRCIECRKC